MPSEAVDVDHGRKSSLASSTPLPPPTRSPGRTAGFQSMRVSGSRSTVSNCVAIVSTSNTCCGIAPGAAATRSRIKSPARTTRHGLPGRNSWPGWGRSFRSCARTAAVTSGSLSSSRNRGRSGRFSHTSANRSSLRPSRRPAARPPSGPRPCGPGNRSTRLTSCSSAR